ncbi:hypothetical protein WN944_000704 [Citrus x changshan-huyou]|uniref:Uncharacterized protein n=1 Tax=Citrus x changshan-huyou TaxID=2935761 RepID=A0AAP0MDE3_9ROSI
MHRSSSSTSRASDEFMVNMLPASLGVTVASSSPLLASDHDRDLPTYANIPISDATKKEMAAMHRKSSLGENAIHLIPLLLIFCALILWLFSLPATRRQQGPLTVSWAGLVQALWPINEVNPAQIRSSQF